MVRMQNGLPGHAERGPGPRPRKAVTLCFFCAQRALQGLIFSRAGGSSGWLHEAGLRNGSGLERCPRPAAGAVASGPRPASCSGKPGGIRTAELTCSRAAHSCGPRQSPCHSRSPCHSHVPRHSSGRSDNGDTGS